MGRHKRYENWSIKRTDDGQIEVALSVYRDRWWIRAFGLRRIPWCRDLVGAILLRRHTAAKTFEPAGYDSFIAKALHAQYPDAPQTGWLKPDDLRSELRGVACRMGWIEESESTSCDRDRVGDHG